MTKNPFNTDLLSAVNLRLNPKGFNGVYGCMIEFQSGESSNMLRYKQQFEYLGERNGQNHLFRITRFEDIFINDRKPDSFLEELSHEVSMTLYPLDVECNSTGSFKIITNFPEIQKRWSVKKDELLNKYTDESVQKYIEKVCYSLAFKERLLVKLESDYFLSVYFKPIFIYYTAFLSFETNLSFPVLGLSKPVNFKVNQSIDEKQLQQNEYRIHINGQIDDDRSLADLEQKFDYPNYSTEDEEEKGSCSFIYLLNNKTKIIEGINGVFDLKFGSTRKVLVKMFLLE
ncbi:hypothetical protein [Zobellia uliginosa]|uniref:hypothetical protein n=1 Tax=Zobellia uliginosa TaxID=143224 RepID=UPI001C0672D5|nr:hypothetical protein [Zobellia uliginosa]MBU2946312.1 hypothetical protein [Zobellia uliginosa]